MAGSGKITVGARLENPDTVVTDARSLAKSLKYVMVYVSDTGTGISDELKQKIFEPFYTTKDPGRGTGLGLSTVAKIVEETRGELIIESEVGHGTTFKLYFPVFDEEVQEKSTTDVEPIPEGTGEQVLIVDDEESIREMTRAVLEANGYRIMIANNGGEAVGVYAAHQSDISVVISDVMMPAMDGFQLLKALRSINSDVRVIMTSGLTGRNLPDLAEEEGAIAFLHKPFVAESLLRIVAKGISTEVKRDG